MKRSLDENGHGDDRPRGFIGPIARSCRWVRPRGSTASLNCRWKDPSADDHPTLLSTREQRPCPGPTPKELTRRARTVTSFNLAALPSRTDARRDWRFTPNASHRRLSSPLTTTAGRDASIEQFDAPIVRQDSRPCRPARESCSGSRPYRRRVGTAPNGDRCRDRPRPARQLRFASMRQISRVHRFLCRL